MFFNFVELIHLELEFKMLFWLTLNIGGYLNHVTTTTKLHFKKKSNLRNKKYLCLIFFSWFVSFGRKIH